MRRLKRGRPQLTDEQLGFLCGQISFYVHAGAWNHPRPEIAKAAPFGSEEAVREAWAEHGDDVRAWFREHGDPELTRELAGEPLAYWLYDATPERAEAELGDRFAWLWRDAR